MTFYTVRGPAAGATAPLLTEHPAPWHARAMMAPDRVEHLERPEGCVIELRVYNAPARRTLILTNGLGCGESSWRYLLDDLARDHRVVTWDLRGQGASTPASGPGAYSASALAGDLAAVQDAAGAATAVHIGFGVGALIALEHLSWTEGSVEALVLIQGGLPPGQGRLPLTARLSRGLLVAASPFVSLGAPLLRREANVELTRRLARSWGLVGHTVGAEDFAAMLGQASRQSVARGLAVLRALSAHRPVDPLSKVKVPTLVFAAEQDPLFPQALARQVHESLHNSELVPLPGASHTCLIELGPIIAARVRRFLEEHHLLQSW